MTPAQLQAIENARARSRDRLGGKVPQEVSRNAFSSAQPGEYGMGTRAGLSMKMTPAGEEGYMRSQPGVHETIRDPSGNLYTIGDQGFRRVDPEGFDRGDIADFAGPAAEMAPAVGAGLMTANPLAVGAGAAAGNAFRQGISATLPGDDQLGMADRAKMVGAMGVTGGAGQLAGNAVMRGVDALRPKNMYFGRVNKRSDPNVLADSEYLEKKTGIGMSHGQYTGDSGLLQIEGLLRQHPMTISKVAKFDEGQLEQSVMHLDSMLKGISPKGTSPAAMGQRVGEATEQLVGQLVSKRRMVGEKDFQQVEALGGAIPVENAKQTISQIIEQFDVPGGGDATATIAKRLRKVLTELDDPSLEGGIPPTKLNRLMQVYGSASRGSGSLFKDIHSAQQRMVAGRVVKALEDDLTAAAANAGDDPGAKALLKARANYTEFSKQIGEIENTVIGKIIGADPKSPESITQRLMQMHPSELRQSMGILGKTGDAGLTQAVKRRFVEEIFEGSVKGASHQRATGTLLNPDESIRQNINFSPDKMLSSLTKPKVQAQMKAMFDKKELHEINATTELLRRLSNRAGTGGSQTGPLLFAADMIKTIASPNPAHLMRGAATAIAPGRMVGMLMDPHARKSLMIMKRSKKWTKASAGAATYLWTTYGTEVLDPVREPPGAGDFNVEGEMNP